MTLKSSISKDTSGYHTPAVRQLFYDHLPNIRKTAEITTVSGLLGNKYRNNLYGLYYHLKIPQRLWNLTSLINKFDERLDITTLTTVMVPNRQYVDNLVKTLKTVAERPIA